VIGGDVLDRLAVTDSFHGDLGLEFRRVVWRSLIGGSPDEG
jgi:hypothetical protein